MITGNQEERERERKGWGFDGGIKAEKENYLQKCVLIYIYI